MRLPVIPFVVAVTLLAAVWYLFTATRSGHRTLDVPRLARLADVDGIETEVAITPDGGRLAIVAGGKLWVLKLSTGERKQLTQTEDPVSFPDWKPDGKRVTFTRGLDTYAIDPDTGAEE